MKEKKFSIEVIEKGRLSREESNKLFGGDVYKPLCDGTFIDAKECYAYTLCTIDQIGQRGYVNCPPDAVKYTQCMDIYRIKV